MKNRMNRPGNKATYKTKHNLTIGCMHVHLGLFSLHHQVLLCVHNPTKILYAMKVVPKSKISTQKQINQILAECRILQ